MCFDFIVIYGDSFFNFLTQKNFFICKKLSNEWIKTVRSTLHEKLSINNSALARSVSGSSMQNFTQTRYKLFNGLMNFCLDSLTMDDGGVAGPFMSNQEEVSQG